MHSRSDLNQVQGVTRRRKSRRDGSSNKLTNLARVECLMQSASGRIRFWLEQMRIAHFRARICTFPRSRFDFVARFVDELELALRVQHSSVPPSVLEAGGQKELRRESPYSAAKLFVGKPINGFLFGPDVIAFASNSSHIPGRFCRVEESPLCLHSAQS